MFFSTPSPSYSLHAFCPQFINLQFIERTAFRGCILILNGMLVTFLHACWAQEVVEGKGGTVADGNIHHVALVVTQKNVSFYMDAKLLSVHNISRPITDCHGSLLEFGDDEVPHLGEITFFARALTTTEMDEIIFTGFTLQSISSGKKVLSVLTMPIAHLINLATSLNTEIVVLQVYAPALSVLDMKDGQDAAAFGSAEDDRSVQIEELLLGVGEARHVSLVRAR